MVFLPFAVSNANTPAGFCPAGVFVFGSCPARLLGAGQPAEMISCLNAQRGPAFRPVPSVCYMEEEDIFVTGA